MCLAGNASAADVRVLSSNAMREAMLAAAPDFEKASGHKVSMEFVGSVDILKRLRAGDRSADIIMLQNSSIDELTAEGLVAKGSRTDIARSLVGVAVRAGAPRPDISSGDALKRTLLKTKSIVVSSGPSGVYMLALFEKMGIPRDHYKQLAVGVQTGQWVARGEAELCFQQVSELLPVKGIDVLGSLPSDVQHVTVFSAGLHSASPHPQAAKALLQYLASLVASPVLKAKGMEPMK
jgi:molybdate transport system substrate-binding protein